MPFGNGEDSTALLLRGGTVIDGSGAPRFAADVRIEGFRALNPAAHKPVLLLVNREGREIFVTVKPAA